MKKISKILTAVLAGAMLLSVAGCGSSSTTSSTSTDSTLKTVSEGKLTWATNAEFEPYEYRDGDDIVGIDAEVAEAIATKLGLEAAVEDMAFDSVIPAITSGKADIGLAGMTVTEDRKASVDFSDTYVTTGQVIIVKQGSDITDEKGLEGKTIGVQLGTTGDLYASDNIANSTVEQFPKYSDAIEAVKTDKVDAVVIDSQPAKKFIEANSDLVMLDKALTEESYAIAIPKGNEELLTAINTALSELKESGELDAILDKYLTEE